ncbi:MAG: transposase [Desulfosalsimonadaceae bacterium]
MSDKERGWLAILSTDAALAESEIIRLYGKRWDIEVFFKMCKQHLKLVKEVQLRDFDGLIGHTSMVIARYNILTWFQRQKVDQRSFGDLFRFCNEEMENIKFIDALKRIMQMAMAAILAAKTMSEQIMQSIMDVIMGAAITFFGLSCNKFNLIPVC